MVVAHKSSYCIHIFPASLEKNERLHMILITEMNIKAYVSHLKVVLMTFPIRNSFLGTTLQCFQLSGGKGG